MVMFHVSVLDQKYPFTKIRSKNSKLFVYGETCNLDSLEYVELYDDAHFLMLIFFHAKIYPPRSSRQFLSLTSFTHISPQKRDVQL